MRILIMHLILTSLFFYHAFLFPRDIYIPEIVT